MRLVQNFKTLEETKKYWSLVVIESNGKEGIKLPMSLKIDQSDFFDKVLFVLLGPESFESGFIQDLLEYQKILPKADERPHLPSNVIYIQNNEEYLRMVTDGFAMRPSTKINYFGNDRLTHLFKWYQIYEKDLVKTRFQLYKAQKLNDIKELDLFLDAEQLPIPNKLEEQTMIEVIKKITAKIELGFDQITRDTTKFVHQVFNLVKGVLESKKIDSQNPEKLTMIILSELLATEAIKCQPIYQEILLGKINSIQQLEKLSQIQISDRFMSPLQKQMQDASNLVQNLKSNVAQALPVQNSNIINEQIYKNEAIINNLNETKPEFKPCMYLHIKEVVKVFLSSFAKANTGNTKKPLKIIQTIMNYTKNEVTSRSKSKHLSEIEKPFYLQFSLSPEYHNLCVYNVYRFLVNQEVMRFEGDKEMSYNLQKIEYLNKIPIEQVFKEDQDVSHDITITAKFMEDPFQVLSKKKVEISKSAKSSQNNSKASSTSSKTTSSNTAKSNDEVKRVTISKLGPMSSLSSNSRQGMPENLKRQQLQDMSQLSNNLQLPSKNPQLLSQSSFGSIKQQPSLQSQKSDLKQYLAPQTLDVNVSDCIQVDNEDF